MLATAILTTAALATGPFDDAAPPQCVALNHAYTPGPLLGDGRQPGKIACGTAGGWTKDLNGLPTDNEYLQWPTMDWDTVPGYGQLLVLPCSDGSWVPIGAQFAASENCRTNQLSEACSVPTYDSQTTRTCLLRDTLTGEQCTAFEGGRDINCDEVETDLSIPTFLLSLIHI